MSGHNMVVQGSKRNAGQLEFDQINSINLKKKLRDLKYILKNHNYQLLLSAK